MKQDEGMIRTHAFVITEEAGEMLRECRGILQSMTAMSHRKHFFSKATQDISLAVRRLLVRAKTKPEAEPAGAALACDTGLNTVDPRCRMDFSVREEVMKKSAFLLFIALVVPALSGHPAAAEDPALTLTIIYDNYPADRACQTDWGFSCLISGLKKTILFDSGTNEDIFLKNAETLKIDLGRIDFAVISHFHGDHTGGLEAALRKRPGLPIYVPVDGDPSAALVSEKLLKAGARLIPVGQPLKLKEGLSLTGTMGRQVKEQSIIFDTRRGLIIVTGCAHPGIVSILEKANEITGRPIEAVLGGFHLMQTDDAEVGRIIARFKELGVSRVGASHCTGDRAIKLFKDAYKDRFVELGAGRILTLER